MKKDSSKMNNQLRYEQSKIIKKGFTDFAFPIKQKELLEGNTCFKRTILLWAGNIISTQDLVR